MAEENTSPSEWKPDPEYAEFLREAQKPVNDNEVFLKTYGFPHDCHCAEDYENGEVAFVSNCWAAMCDDALETCAQLKAERDELQLRVAQLTAEASA